MDFYQLCYALNRHVPSISERGVTLQTTYGDLPIEPGKLASAIAKLVREHYEAEHAKLALGQS